MSDFPQDQITVLHLCEHFGGAEASLHGVARSFQWWIPLFKKERFRVLLCSRKGVDKAYEEMVASGLTPKTLGYGKYDIRNLFALVRLLRKEKVQIIHAHGFGASMWGRLAGIYLKLPVIVHGRCNYGSVPFFQRPVEWILGPRTCYALAVSESTRQFTIKKRYIPASNVQLLYNGIILDRVVHLLEGEVSRLRKEVHGVQDGTTIIGIVGRLESHKGHLDALAALKYIQDLSVQIWIIGDGSYTEEIEAKIVELNLGDRVRMLGFRRDIIECIQCLDIQLFPSHKEGTPNTLYEALAVGNPIVASTSDGQGEILEQGKNAELFEPGDIEAMANALRKLILNAKLRKERGQAALLRSQDFDGRQMICKIETLYEKIVSEFPRYKKQ